MLPRRPPPLPAFDSGREFGRMSQADLARLIDYTCRLGPQANQLWMRDTRMRHKAKFPLRHQPSDDMATFLRNTYRNQRWEPETHLDVIPGFDGYQREFASLVNHVLQESRAPGNLRNEWHAHLAAWTVEEQGFDPRRHGVRLLDAFLGALLDKVWVSTWPRTRAW